MSTRLDDVNWARSSFCSTNGCVEVARVGDVIRVRDGKSGDGSPTIDYTPDQWVLFLARVVEEGMPREAFLRLDDGGVDLVRSTPEGSTVLVLDRDEWDSFVTGVENGQFDLPRLSAQVPARAVADGAVSGHPGPDAASVAEGSRPGTPSATLDSPAGQQSADTSSGCADADRPGSDRYAAQEAFMRERELGMSCGNCGQRTGNNTQGHYWAYCGVTGQMEIHHFCCPGACDRARAWREAYEALAANVAALGVPASPNYSGSIPRNDPRWLSLVAAAKAMDSDMAAWELAIAPLVERVPNEDSPTATSEEGAVQTGCGTGGGGEVAPATVGVSAGATEPADECDGADR